MPPVYFRVYLAQSEQARTKKLAAHNLAGLVRIAPLTWKPSWLLP
jgi:hypothetical protein